MSKTLVKTWNKHSTEKFCASNVLTRAQLKKSNKVKGLTVQMWPKNHKFFKMRLFY